MGFGLIQTQKVPQKITANLLVRVKMYGKSVRSLMATLKMGKPCMLKCPIGKRLKAARLKFVGRQMDFYREIKTR